MKWVFRVAALPVALVMFAVYAFFYIVDSFKEGAAWWDKFIPEIPDEEWRPRER